MELLAFRIFNFRSIVDSEWVAFSPDGVTVLVGQNESGKTSILQALSCGLGLSPITADDKRISAQDPYFHFRFKVSYQDVVDSGYFDDPTSHDASSMQEYLAERSGVVELGIWRTAKAGASSLTELHKRLLDEERFTQILTTTGNEVKSVLVGSEATETPGGTAAQPSSENDEHVPLTAALAAEIFYQALPLATLFSAETGLLPNTVDIDEKGAPTGPGAVAAVNYLSIAEIDLPGLVKGDGRYRQNILNRANQRLTDDFAAFWSQVIGAKSKLSLQCAFEFYGSAAGDKAGKPYLEFWISDGNTQLYPKQRSQGVRWFVSFYLQLRSTEKSRNARLFLLDEPGANLHDKAQEDVLKLIDALRSEIPIIYSTHSPKMIEYEKLFRIRAVQRDDEQEDSPTRIIDAHHLGAASSDTLSPLLAAMGSDMSQQAVIKKKRNVLLEEVSGYYYLAAFWKLENHAEEAYFIAATGVNKVPQLANMFLGWGLDFVVAVDDDRQGREVYNQLKKELCGDSDELARKRLLKFPGRTAIEEVFSPADFKKYVLRNEAADVSVSNAEYMRAQHLSKPVTALQFLLAVSEGTINLKSFDAETRQNISQLTQAVCEVLAAADGGSAESAKKRRG